MLNESNLHDYQRACVEHIISTPFCGVFLEMGLGKTVSTLTAIDRLMYDYLEITSVLVIAPKRVAETVWEEEAERWEHLKHLTFSKIIGSPQQRVGALTKRADVYIISRDNVAWLCAYCGGMKLPFDMIVVDELSSFKAHDSQRFKSLKACQPSFKRFVGLTGTPAPNGLIDLWSQIYLMDRGERLGKTITNYRSTYFRPGKTNGNVVFSYLLREGSEKVIRERIKDICISMKTEDYIKMPERTDNFIRLKLSKGLKERYNVFEREKVFEYLNSLEEVEGGDPVMGAISVTNAAALSNKLLQFANGAVYDENGEVHKIHSIKVDALKEIIENANGKPVLVAWSYRFDRDRLMEELKEYGPRELRTPKDIKDWNDGKIQVLLAHPASAGHGLNLQAGGSIIVWYGLTWSLELYQQFNARLYRQGQKEHVVINHLVMDETQDTDVVRALQSKSTVQNALMESVKAKIDKYKSLWEH